MTYILKIPEELGELQSSFLHYLNNKTTKIDVIEEIVDTIIQLEKIASLLMFNSNEDLNFIYERILEKKRVQLSKIIYND